MQHYVFFIQHNNQTRKLQYQLFSTEFMFIAHILHYQINRMMYCNGIFKIYG